jgi:hypothetical protein
MPNPSNTGVGTDGVVPINLNGRFTVWSLKEIYTGHQGDARYVPKVDDLIIDMDLGLQYKVTSVDPVSLLSQWVPLKEIPSGDFTPEDLLLGVGPGTQADTYRCYIDRSVVPFALAVDARLCIFGTAASYVKIFRGTDLTDDGEIVSHMYDSQGNIVGNAIPLELVQMPNGQNLAVKAVPVCYTMTDIPDNEVLTVVAYADGGHVVSKRQVLAENTAFIRSANLGVRYIIGISLECPFLSTSDPRLIELPQNVLLQGVNMLGVVHYSNGDVVKMPVDGDKFALFGMEGYTATIVNQQGYLSLRYRVSAEEIVYGAQVGQFAHISEPYRLKTMPVDGNYSVKLFGYPVWKNDVEGYGLRWYLYNGNRSVVYDVTQHVSISDVGPAFNPILYGTLQRLSVAVNLQDANPSFRNYRHTQTYDLVLWGPGSLRTTNWVVGFDVNQNPPFGMNNHAELEFINVNLFRLRVDTSAANLDEWLERLYYRTRPIIDPTRESVPPAPTHYVIKVGNTDLEFPISQWNSETTIGPGLTDNGTVFIRFIKKTPDSDLQLAVAAMPVYQIEGV